jgi:hypothetical protein
MITEETLEELNLRRDWVERDLNLSQELAEGYTNLALHSEGPNAREVFAISASYFRRAAADALLLGRSGYYGRSIAPGMTDAYTLFREATNAYENARIPYSAFICAFIPKASGSRQFVNEWLERVTGLESEAFPHLLHLLMYTSVMFREWQEVFSSMNAIRQRLELYRLEPIGVLGTPIGNYLDLIDAFTERTETDRIERAIYPFLSQYSFSVRQAQKNEYHWQRLAMPFHPAEPDIFGVLLFTNRVLRSINDNRSILGLIERFPIDRQATSLLFGILSDYEVDGNDAGTFQKEPVPRTT